MLITRESDYALRIIRSLSDGRQKKTAEIIETESIPKHFTYKILKKLDKSRIVEVRPGNSGGCRLTADLSQVSLYDVMASIGDTVLLNACTRPGYQCHWELDNNQQCAYHRNLIKLQETIINELKGVSLLSMLQTKI